MRLVAGWLGMIALVGCEGSASIDPDDWDDEEGPERPEWDTPPTVRAIQQGAIGEGETVQLYGLVVSGIAWDGIWVQEPEGGPWSGIFVWLGAPADANVPWTDVYDVGDLVNVEGDVIEYAQDPDQYAIDTVTMLISSESDVTVTARGEPVWPTSADPFDLFDPDMAEPYEGVLLAVQQPFVVEAFAGYDRFEVEPGVMVSRDLFDAPPVYFGDRFTAIVGIWHFQYGGFELLPRSENDWVGYASEVTPIAGAAAGALVVTEVMAAPVACDDARAEYIELYNASGGILDLEGLEIRIGSGSSTVADRFLVGPGDIVLVTPFEDRCVGPTPHLTTGITMDDVGATVSLRGPSGVIDTVNTSGWGGVGTSLQLDARAWDANSNDVQGNWCTSSTADGELDGPDGTDIGSPGYANQTTCF
jgi:hypothetical protein